MGGRPPAWRWIAGGVAAAVAASGLTAILRDDTPPDPGPPAAATPSVTYPVSGMVVTVAPATPLPAAAVGVAGRYAVSVRAAEAVSALELWSDDAPVDVVELAQPAAETDRLLTWTPEAPGAHVVFARAIGDGGRTGQSNVLRVDAVPTGTPIALDVHIAVAGETFGMIESARGVTRAELIALNPQLDPDAPLPEGVPVSVPVTAAAPGTALAATDLPADAPPDVAAMVLAGRTARPRPARPTARRAAAPDLTAAVDGCTAEVETRGGAAVVSMLGPGDEVFVPVQTGAASTVAASIGPGPHLLVATDPVTNAMSPPVPVVGPAECAGTWTGDVRLVDGVLHAEDAADVAYLYLRAGDAGWVRVPEHDGEFVPGAGGKFDFGAYLPDLHGERLEIEAWGWRGGLVELGTGTLVPPPDGSVAAVAGGARAITLSWIAKPAKGSQPEVLSAHAALAAPTPTSFRWKSALPGVTHARWQVTATPPAPKTGLDPPGLLAAGTSKGASTGTFTVDFAKVVAGTAAVGSVSATLPQSAYMELAGSVVSPGAAPNSPAAPAGSGGATSTVDALAFVDASTFSVRAIPFAGDQYLGTASNTVNVQVLEGLGAAFEAIAKLEHDVAPDAYQLALSVDPPRAPSPGYMGCLQFVRWDWDEVAANYQDPNHKFQYSFWFGFLGAAKAYGDDKLPICSGCYTYGATTYAVGGADIDECTESDLEWVAEQFAGALQTLWDDIIVGTFNSAKGWLVDTLVTLTGCEEMVGAGTSDAKAEQWCHAAATVVVDAVLIYFGVPPNLPTFSQAIEGAKGDLAALAVEYAKAAGVPCDAIGATGDVLGKDELDCEAAVEAMLDEVQSQVEASWNDVATQVLGPLPPGLVLAPHPSSQSGPATVKVTVTRTPKSPLLGTTCNVLLTSSAQHYPNIHPDTKYMEQPSAATFHVATTFTGMSGPALWAVPFKLYSGQAFVAVNGALPKAPAAKGSSQQRSYSLYVPVERDPVTAWRVFTEQGANGKVLDPSTYASLPYHTLQLQTGADFTVTAHAGCAKDVSATVKVPTWSESVLGGVAGEVAGAVAGATGSAP